jgi:hypothetical protein
VSWAPDYSTTARVKNYLRITDTDDDLFIAAWLTAVSRNIDDHAGRQFGQVDEAEERTYGSTYSRSHLGYVCDIDDLQDVTGLEVLDANGNAVTGYTLWPRNAPQKGKPYTQIHGAGGSLAITALWGWSAVPPSVETAIWLQAARLAARRDSPFGVAGSPTEGSEIRLLAQLDPDFRTTLKPFVRKWWAA